MNVKNPHFTMRHLIMGLGRVQESKRVKILDPEREKRMVLPAAREVFDQYNKWALERKKEEEEAARLLAAADEAVNADDADVDAALSDDEEEAGFHGDCFEDLELDD
jgi:siroheme synthase (precorrin-2 oxidase/ferrochelatase)